MSYLGITPSQATRSRYYYTASGGETSISGADDNSNVLTFTDGNYVDVSLNGAALVAGSDYNTSTANTISGLAALTASDVVEVIVYGTFSVFGGNMAADLNFKDNVKINMGTGNDLQIYHDGSNSIINDVGTGELQLQVAGTTRFNTTATGVNVTGTLNITGDGDDLIVNSSDYELVLLGNRGSTGVNVDQAYLRMKAEGTNTIALDTAGNSYFNGGNVGIGTTSPDANSGLTIFSTTYPSLYLDNNSTTGGGAIRFHKQGVNQGLIASSGWILGDTSNDIGVHAGTSNALRFYTNGNNERLRIDSSGNVGIGDSSPYEWSSVQPSLNLRGNSASFPNRSGALIFRSQAGTHMTVMDFETGNDLRWYQSSNSGSSWDERMRLDSSGNLLVGKTSSAFGTAGVESSASGGIWSTRSVFQPASFNLLSNDGPIAAFYKDSALVGTIGSRSGNLYIGSGDTTLKFEAGGDYIVPASTTGADRDNAIDLGNTATQFKNLYLSGGVYLGGTGSANYLDDYEEGTWNVTIVNGSLTPTITLASYTKIGNRVFLSCNISVPTNSEGTYMALGGGRTVQPSQEINDGTNRRNNPRQNRNRR
jgi:hypothetical protein